MTQFTWRAKAKQTLEVYRWTRGERDKPDFGIPFGDPRRAASIAPPAHPR
jgi:hypothetical protein